MTIILASTSPRRREILALLGLPFEVIDPSFDERALPDRPIEDEVLDFALGKAESVARHRPEGIVVGSDTMILIDGRKIGKPEGIDDAKAMLHSLSGKIHRIFTSVAILDGSGGPGLRTVEQVSVKMRDYSEAEIERYLSAGESLGKAGAYSIQGHGGALIDSIDGDYLAAVGLPLRPIAGYLKSRGIAVPVDVDTLYSQKSFPNWPGF
jgi:septum formation protein